MRAMGLRSCVAKTFKPTTTQADPSKAPAPNVLDQDFQADGPNQKWVTDITYLPITTGWVYLAVVLDLFSRKIVGSAIDTSLVTDLVCEAMTPARSLISTASSIPSSATLPRAACTRRWLNLWLVIPPLP